MSDGSGVSWGDRNRNPRLTRRLTLVPAGNAIVGIDLADAKQMVVVTDHDSKVLVCSIFRCRAWNLGVALDWAAGRAVAAWVRQCDGGVWADRPPVRVLGQLSADRGGCSLVLNNSLLLAFYNACLSVRIEFDAS